MLKKNPMHPFAAKIIIAVLLLFESLRDLFPAPWGVKYSRERVYS